MRWKWRNLGTLHQKYGELLGTERPEPVITGRGRPRVRQQPNAEDWGAMKGESPANGFQMVPTYFHNNILNVIAHLSATVKLTSPAPTKWRRIASGEHRSSAGVTTKNYKSERDCAIRSTPFSHFLFFLSLYPDLPWFITTAEKTAS